MSFDRESLPDPWSYYREELPEGLRGGGIWRTACCPAHGGWSLRINIKTGAFCCMGCGELSGGDVLSFHMQTRGLEFVEAAKSLGAWRSDGTPERPRKPTPLSARAAVGVLKFEATMVAIAAGNIGNGTALSDRDRRRVLRASGRIIRVTDMFE